MSLQQQQHGDKSETSLHRLQMGAKALLHQTKKDDGKVKKKKTEKEKR